MEENKEMTKEEIKTLLAELKQKCDPVEQDNAAWLEEFSIELQLAMRVFFEGRVTRDGQKITLAIPKGHKFRVTVELVS